MLLMRCCVVCVRVGGRGTKGGVRQMWYQHETAEGSIEPPAGWEEKRPRWRLLTFLGRAFVRFSFSPRR